MRLKFDRLINIMLWAKESATVPQGELWKVNTITFDDSYDLSGRYVKKSDEPTLLSNGVTITCRTGHGNPLFLQGVAFKVVKEE